MTTSHRFFMASTALLWAGLTACTHAPIAAGCAPSEISADQLVGTWQLDLAGQTGAWTLVLRPHPEHQGSLRGTLMQNPLHYAVVADIEDGEFTMEESHDGRRIAATWLGRVAMGSCGKVLTGERQAGAAGTAPQRFEMRQSVPR
jgi:hypothetical protein